MSEPTSSTEVNALITSSLQGMHDIEFDGFSSLSSYQKEKKSRELYRVYSPQDWLKFTRVSISPTQLSYKELEMNLCSGIPDNLRPRIWLWLSSTQDNCSKLTQKQESISSAESEYLRMSCFEKLSQTESPCDQQILNDVRRTLPQHRYFSPTGEGQLRTLFLVLRAYANYDKEIGYVQGMNYIAAHILLCLRSEQYKNVAMSFGKFDEFSIEYLAYKVFVHVMCTMNWRETYAGSLVRHRVMLQELVGAVQNPLKGHLEKYEFDSTAAFSGLYLTLLLKNAPFPLARRILDVFLIAGDSIVNQFLGNALKEIEEDIVQIHDPVEIAIEINEELLTKVYAKCKHNLIQLFQNQSQNVSHS